MLRKFISWKKNIRSIDWNGLYVLYYPCANFEELWNEISSLIISDKTFSFDNEISKGTVNIEKNQYGKGIHLEKKDSSSKDYSLSEYIGFSHRMKSKTYNERIILTIKNKNLNRELINKLLSHNQVYFAVLFNPYFKSWENRKFKNMYYYSGGLKEELRPELGVKTIDLSKRPGRYTNCYEFNFLGGSEYWISQKLLPREKLESISDVEIDELESNNLIHVKLFDLSQYWEDSSQNKIAKLRKLLQIDEKSKS